MIATGIGGADAGASKRDRAAADTPVDLQQYADWKDDAGGDEPSRESRLRRPPVITLPVPDRGRHGGGGEDPASEAELEVPVFLRQRAK